MINHPRQSYVSSKARHFGGSEAGRFLLIFLQLQIMMGLGALMCYLVVRLLSTSPDGAQIYRPGTLLFAAGDIFFLAAPVVAWMAFRGAGWRHSLQMAVTMTSPIVMIIVIGRFTTYDYLTWLLTAGYPAMSLGMVTYMLYRRDDFTWHSNPVLP